MASDRDQQLTQAAAVLNSSQDREALESAASMLAASNDPIFLEELGKFLQSGEGLARLDDLDDPSSRTYHLARVLETLERNPSPATAALCLRLLESPDFLADDDRKIFLLPALAAVRPMTEPAIEVFRITNAEGFYSLNVRLLVKNASPLALRLFEEMILDNETPPQRRVDGMHAGVLPMRTELAVLQSMSRLLGADLPRAVRLGAIETVFDYRSREWFGPARQPPAPPPWESASTEALRFLRELAKSVRQQSELPPALVEAVDATETSAGTILASRRAL